MTEPVRRTVLNNGTRVVSETIPGARSLSLGVWVGVGSRDEPADAAGVSHFLEHLVFKGTRSRSGRDIAVAVDAVGGDFNAYTAKEHTVFYLRVPASAAAMATDVLFDVLRAPRLGAADVRSEREVILEELAGADDSAEDRVEQLVWEGLFPDHPLGWDIIGSEATVEAMTRAKVSAFFERWYRPANLVVAAAGAVDHDELVRAARQLDSRRSSGETPVRLAPAALGPVTVSDQRSSEQVQVALGWRSVGYHHADRVALDVVEQVLGGGPSSRLFQQVREERALAYSVYAGATEYVDIGGLTICLAVSPGRLAATLAVVDEIVADLAQHGVTDEELAVAKGYLEGSLWLGLEDPGGRMARIGWHELAYGHVPDPQHYLEAVAALTSDDVARVAAEVLGGVRVVATVGPGSQG